MSKLWVIHFGGKPLGPKNKPQGQGRPRIKVAYTEERLAKSSLTTYKGYLAPHLADSFEIVLYVPARRRA